MKDNPKVTKKIIEDFFDKLGIEARVTLKEEEQGVQCDIEPGDNKLSSLLIGYRGENLLAIQHLLRILVRKKIEEPIKLLIDISGYRQKHQNSLKEMVLNLAERVKKTQRVELLRPMTAYERRIVHLAIKEIKGLMTQSVGEEPNRRVLIKPE